MCLVLIRKTSITLKTVALKWKDVDMETFPFILELGKQNTSRIQELEDFSFRICVPMRLLTVVRHGRGIRENS